MKKVFMLILIMFLLVLPNKVYASSYQYQITNYGVDLLANESNATYIIENVSSNFNYFTLIPLIMIIVFLSITFIMWLIYGKNEKIVKVVSPYPSTELNSVQLELLYNGYITTPKNVTMIIHLANKGYLKIIESKEKEAFLNKTQLNLVKLKEYDGNDEDERKIFNGIFFDSDVVTPFDAGKKVYNIFFSEDNTYKDTMKEFRILMKKMFKKIILVFSMSWIIFFTITLVPIIQYGQFDIIDNLPFSLIAPGISFMLFTLGLFIKGNMRIKIILIIVSVISGSQAWIFFVLPTLIFNGVYFITYFCGLISITLMTYMLIHMNRRTKYANEIFGKTTGFKTFIKRATKVELQSLIMNNPTYVYDILPYVYALNISDMFIKKIESINLTPPEWYEANEMFNIKIFDNFIKTIMLSVKVTITDETMV